MLRTWDFLRQGPPRDPPGPRPTARGPILSKQNLSRFAPGDAPAGKMPEAGGYARLRGGPSGRDVAYRRRDIMCAGTALAPSDRARGGGGARAAATGDGFAARFCGGVRHVSVSEWNPE